jgi:recombination protein RecA
MSIEAVMADINKSIGEGSVYRGSDIRDKVLPRITSGSLALDWALGGGWAANQWNEVVGQESSGKTAMVLMAIAANQRLDPNFLTVWIAAEEFVHEYAEMWGVDTNRVIIIDTNVMEEAYDAAIKFIDSHEIDCLVIDSLPQLIPESEDDGSMEDFQVGLAARLNGKFFRKGRKALKRSQTSDVEERACTGFIINQWREKIGVRYGDPRTTPGGKAKDFAYFIKVEVYRDEWIKDGTVDGRDNRVGQSVVVRNIKNKTAPPSRYAHYDFYFADVVNKETGEIIHPAGRIDVAKEMIAMGQELEVIKRRGAYFDFPNGDTVKGKEALAAKAGDPEMVSLVRKHVMARLAGEVIDEGPTQDEVASKPKAGAKDRKPQRRVVQRGKR